MMLMINLSQAVTLWLSELLRTHMVAPAIGSIAMLCFAAVTFIGTPIFTFFGVAKLNQMVTRKPSHETQ